MGVVPGRSFASTSITTVAGPHTVTASGFAVGRVKAVFAGITKQFRYSNVKSIKPPFVRYFKMLEMKPKPFVCV